MESPTDERESGTAAGKSIALGLSARYVALRSGTVREAASMKSPIADSGDSSAARRSLRQQS